MKTLLCFFPDELDCTSFYRGQGPLQTLRRKDRQFEMVITKDLNWVKLKSCDGIFFQRPWHPQHLAAIKAAKRMNKPVWLDYDDNLMAVPMSNKRYDLYSDPGIEQTIITMLQLSDVVTVTTKALEDVFKPYAKSIRVVPNAYDPECLGDLRAVEFSQNKHITWRGGDSHTKDLLPHLDVLERIIKDNPDWLFEFMGNTPWQVMERLRFQNVVMTPAMDPIEYFAALRLKKPAIMIVPLQDTAFNRAKSNIAWLEAASAGAIVLAQHSLSGSAQGS